MSEYDPSLDTYLQQGNTPQLRPGEVGKTLRRRSSNINLRKSIQLLDDAVSLSINRPPRTPRGFRHSAGYTPVRPDVSSHLDSSDLFRFTPSKTTILSTQSPIQYTEDMTNLRMTFIADEDPGKSASSGMFESFRNVLQQHKAPHQVMELLSGYESVCSEQVSAIKKLSKCMTRNQPKLMRTMDTHDLLQHEKNTWKLFHSLYKDKLETEARDDFSCNNKMKDDDNARKTVVWSLSEKNIANQLLERDSSVRQSQLVVDWLETCAAEDLNTYFDNAKFFVDQPVSWENTLHHLQKLKQGLRSSSDKFITEMDPDAPQRQRRYLDDLDQEDERFFFQHLYIFLRAGQLDKAQELCHACGQPWRAATLEGWRLLHDPNYYNNSSSLDVSPVEGNPYRDVWKSVCWRMALEPDFNSHEKAVYGTLSGNLNALLPVCVSWMDYLWAYYKVLVDITVEQDIRLHHHTDRILDNLPSEFWDKLLEPHEIFKDISASVNENVRLEAESWYHVIQKFVILGDIPALIETMYSWIKKSKDSLPGHLVRFMAHIVLFLRSIGLDCKEELCETIIEAYVKDLIRDKQGKLIAFYVATLCSQSAQVQLYAKYLEDIEVQTEREQCLARAKEENLDVGLIAKTVVESIRLRETKSGLPENSFAQHMTVTEEDRVKIDAIYWLVIDKAHRSEALKQANAIMRSFIVVKKYAAARGAFQKLPTDTIDVIYRQWHLKTASNELPDSDSNAIREYMCMKAYLDAVESFNDWFSLYHQGQPVKPATVEGGTFTDRVAFEHKMKQYSHEYDRWRHNILLQARVTKDRIYNVLLFADGGWLVDSFKDSDELRQHQLSQLRKLHLPGICLNLHTVLHCTEMYTEALQIADVIASEHHQLYKEFDKESMQHLLLQLSKSSHCLLDQNKDPLGYDIV